MFDKIEKLFSSPLELEKLYGIRKMFKDLEGRKKHLAIFNVLKALKRTKQKSYKPSKEIRKFFLETAKRYKKDPRYANYLPNVSTRETIDPEKEPVGEPELFEIEDDEAVSKYISSFILMQTLFNS